MKTLAILALSLVSVPALASSWEIDSAHSAVGFSVKHMVVTNAKGAFKNFNGRVSWDEKDITQSRIDVTIDAKSIDTNNAKRDEHLRGPDFFDVAKFPSLTFKSTKIEKAKDGKLKVTGDLSLHGVTKAVTLTVDGPSKPIKNPWGQEVASFHASGVLNRKDFGLTWNKGLETGGVLVGDEVSLEIDGELNQAKPTTQG